MRTLLSALALATTLALVPAATAQTGNAQADNAQTDNAQTGDARFDRADPNGTRLFLSPTGYTMGQGTGRVGTYAILPTVAYAPSDLVDVQAFSSIPMDVDGSGGNGSVGVYGVGLKSRVYRTERVAVAVGATAFSLYGVETGGAFVGTVYGAATFGTAEQSVTLGLTGLYGAAADAGVGLAEGAAVSLGLARQVSNSVKLISENHLGFGTAGAAGGTLTGVRFFGDRLSADLALVATVNDSGLHLSPVPYVGVSYRF